MLPEQIQLSETLTIPIFSLQSACVPTDQTELYKCKVDKNTNYESKLTKKIEYKDNFVDRHQQTINANRLHKDSDALVSSTKESGVHVTDFIIADDLGLGRSNIDDDDEKLYDKENSEVENNKGNNSILSSVCRDATLSFETKIEEEMKLALTSNGCLLDLSNFIIAYIFYLILCRKR